MSEIIVAYIPVLHQGYYRFLLSHRDASAVYLLTDQVLSEITYLKKDLRALSPEIIQKSLASWQVFPEIKIMTDKKQLAAIDSKTTVILPDDDLAENLIAQYFSKHQTELGKIFLRWDRNNVEAKTEVDPDEVVSTKALDRELALKAFSVAQHSTDWWRQVGAVLVRDGQILISAFNHHLPDEQIQYVNGDIRSLFEKGVKIELSSSIHAEAAILAAAAKDGIKVWGADLYVNTFPCPMCAHQLAETGINQIFYVTGYSLLNGEAILKRAGVKLIKVILTPEEQAQAAKFSDQHLIKKSIY